MSDPAANDDASTMAALIDRTMSRWLPNVASRLGLDLIADLTRGDDGEVGVVLRRGEQFILKTQDGSLDEPMRLLCAYAELGVACPRIIDAGNEPLSWVLLSYEQGRPTTVADARQRLRQATRLVRRLHEVPPHDDLAWFRRYTADVAWVYGGLRTRPHQRRPTGTTSGGDHPAALL